MAKELVISANRHETKVAVLEDEQLVEIHFQRANEYSLAGSIHKGRVTRVLPGMQSAFVDLGLERDAFLYVSDFVEETEEYDRIPVRSAERAAPETETAGVSERRDRRLRRSRRRRGRPHALPESKYALSGRGRPEESEVQEFAILPGESLAKYRDLVGENAVGESSEPEGAATGLDYEVGAPEAPPEGMAGSSAVRAAQEPEAAVDSSEPAPESHAWEEEIREVEEAAASVSAAARLDEAYQLAEAATEEELEAGGFDEEPEAAEAPGAELEEEIEEETTAVALAEDGGSGAAEAVEETAIEPEAEEESPDEEEMGLAEADPDALEQTAAMREETEGGEFAAAELEPEGGSLEAEPSGEAAPEEVAGAGQRQEIEPARKPVSLTATLREQGLRYLQRPSRRLKRRMRREEAERSLRGEGEARGEEGERPQPSITELLHEGQEVLVQIAKEPLGQKGARITSHITLPGRYVVYMPTVDHLGVSRKISSDEERARLKRILYRHRGKMPGGFIVRTAGEGRGEEEIASDMRFLYNLWLDIRRKAEKAKAPALIHHDLDLVNRVLRDELTEDFKAIWVDNEEVYERVVGFMQRFQPSMVQRVKLYTRTEPIFDAFNISQELEKALRPRVWLKSGGYIVINQTEALVAIDVNTGKFVGKSNRLEDTIFRTNSEAVKEIVRQIRLRDLGGIIVIDFIDMEDRKNRQRLMQALEEAMRVDRAPYKILQFNDFGLVAITRKRVKQSLERALCSPCPYCEGSGYVKSVQTVIGEILQEAHRIRGAVEGRQVMLRVNPEVARVLKSPGNDYLEEMEEILGRPVLVTSDPTMQQEKFDLV